MGLEGAHVPIIRVIIIITIIITHKLTDFQRGWLHSSVGREHRTGKAKVIGSNRV